MLKKSRNETCICHIFCLDALFYGSFERAGKRCFRTHREIHPAGDHESLAVWFANNLELDILGNINDCSKIQATQIIKDFFITYKPSGFTIIHKSGKAPMKYAIGRLNAGGESFRVTLFVKIQPGGNQIQQLRIERDSRP